MRGRADVAQLAWLDEARRLLLEPGASADLLYSRWFHRQTGSTRRWPGASAYLAVLVQPRRLEPGWRVLRSAEGLPGAVVAQRGGRERLLAAPLMVPADPRRLVPVAGDRLLVHPLTGGESGGFWHLWSASWQAAAPPALQRVYLGLGPASALALVDCLADRAPPRAPWAAKILCGRHEAGRRDSAVLYLPAGLDLASDWAARLLAALQPLCADRGNGLPPFVQRLVPGLGAAPDPSGGRSFGQALCAAVATAAPLAGDGAAFAQAAWAAIHALPGMDRATVSGLA